MYWVCSKHEVNEKCTRILGDHSGDVNVDRRIIFKGTLEK
jgi:hypothetical protein